MHELAIAESILKIALEEAQRVRASRIERIRLRIGALSSVVPDSIQFYLNALAPGTIAQGVRLESVTVPIGVTCRRCSHFFLAQDDRLDCPKCGGTGAITQGNELSVESLEVEN